MSGILKHYEAIPRIYPVVIINVEHMSFLNDELDYAKNNRVGIVSVESLLNYNNIKDKPIPNSYPQLQGKIEACNKIVKNEFISVEEHIKHR